MGEEKFCFVLRSGLNSRLILDGLLGVRGIGCVLMNEEQEGATEQQGAQDKARKTGEARSETANQERARTRGDLGAGEPNAVPQTARRCSRRP